jgi:hypothetical protein
MNRLNSFSARYSLLRDDEDHRNVVLGGGP